MRASSKSSAFFPGLVPLPCDQMFSPSSLQQGPGQSRDSNGAGTASCPHLDSARAGDRDIVPSSRGRVPAPSPILPAPAELWQRQRRRGAEPSVGQGVVASQLGVVGMLEPFGVLEYLCRC